MEHFEEEAVHLRASIQGLGGDKVCMSMFELLACSAITCLERI